MGGFGSGRRTWQTKAETVEDCRVLDINRWVREGGLREGVHQFGQWTWSKAVSKEETSSLGYELNTLKPSAAWVRLYYTFARTQEQVDCRIRLVTTRPGFGGLRWWFRCPLSINDVPCTRRVGKLYLPPGGRYFGCRHCYCLSYTSCQESRKYDSLFRRLAKDLGRQFADVKRIMNRIGKTRR